MKLPLSTDNRELYDANGNWLAEFDSWEVAKELCQLVNSAQEVRAALEGMLAHFAGRYLPLDEGGGCDENQEKPWCSGEHKNRQNAIVKARELLARARQ